MLVRDALPSFSDELTKIAASKGGFSPKKILPLLTLSGAAGGLAAGLLTARKIPSPQRLKHIANAMSLGTAIGWTPDVVYSGVKAAKR